MNGSRKWMKPLCVAWSIFLAGPGMGQSDSISLCREIERVERMIEYPQALAEAGKVHQRIMTSGCQGCKVSSLIMMGKVYWVDGRYQPSIDHFRNALAELPTCDSLTNKSIVYTYIGLNFYYQGYYDSALCYHEKSLNVIKAGNNRKRMPRVLNHIALVYHRKGDYKTSLEYMFKMEEILEEFNDRATEVELWGGMENVLIDTLYFRQKIADNQAVLQERIRKNETKDLFTIYYNLGRAHSQLKENLTAARNW